MSAAISAPSRAFRLLLGLFALTLVAAMAFADPAAAAAAVPHAGPLALADPSWVDGFTLHAVTGGGLAAAVAVPKGTMAKLKAAIKNLLGPEATDEQVDAALAAEIAEADPAETTVVPPDTTATDPNGITATIKAAVAAAVAPLQAKVDTLQGALQTEAEGRAAAQKAVETQQATERASSIDTLLAACEKDGRVVPAKKDAWKERLEKDYDTVKVILDEMAPNPALAKGAGKVSADASGKAAEKTAAERPAAGTFAGSVPSAAMDYVTANVN